VAMLGIQMRGKKNTEIARNLLIVELRYERECKRDFLLHIKTHEEFKSVLGT
jgi:hypothetical protein